VLEYVLIIAGIIMLFVTIMPPTWQIDIGTLVLGALLLLQGIRELNRKNMEKETESQA
jgi:uncharacterized membrane protein HdeD (DUF308 family)